MDVSNLLNGSNEARLCHRFGPSKSEKIMFAIKVLLNVYGLLLLEGSDNPIPCETKVNNSLFVGLFVIQKIYLDTLGKLL